MKKSLGKWQIAGFLFTGILGVILHFLFDWTGQSVMIAPFSAVNESIWEHMKLLFFPMFLFAWLESRSLGEEYEGFWCVKLIGILLGILLIPVLYYTLNGVFGRMPDWVNIAIFFVAAAVSYGVETWLLQQDKISRKAAGVAQLILWFIALVFVVFTFIPPHIPLFEDPLTKTYGYS